MMLQNLIFSYFGCKVKQNPRYFQIFSTKKHVIQHKSDINHFIYPKKQSYINKLSLTLLHMKRIVLITGGQRSGKSVQAEKMALSLTDRPVYLATAHIWDDEFRQRVSKHQQRRGPQWTNIEEEKYLSRHDVSGRVVVVDCITLWCINFFFKQGAPEWEQPTVEDALKEIEEEFDRFTSQDATFIFVTNEIGSGGVSADAVQRRFTDLEGWMNQYVAAKADEVILMVSGIPVEIKNLSSG